MISRVNTGNKFFCAYGLRLIDADDDAQRINKSEVAHTRCAFAMNDAFFAALDAESEQEDE